MIQFISKLELNCVFAQYLLMLSYVILLTVKTIIQRRIGISERREYPSEMRCESHGIFRKGSAENYL